MKNQKYENMSDREIAVKENTAEHEVKKERISSGFLRLNEFEDEEELSKTLNISLELEKMERRKIQGFLGEKITHLMKNRVIDRIQDYLKESWQLRNKLNLVSEENTYHRYWASGKPRQGEIRISGRNIKHSGKTEKELKEYIREKCVVARQDKFKKFREVRNPFIDFNFYAVKINGSQEVKFNIEDFSKNRFESNEELEVELPVVEDFKIVMLEVKTSKKDAKKLFSTNQRKARDLAKESPFLEFFSLKIDEEFDSLRIPENYDGEIKKHS